MKNSGQWTLKRDLVVEVGAEAGLDFIAKIEGLVERYRDSRVIIPADTDTASLHLDQLEEIEDLLGLCQLLLEEIAGHYSQLAAEQPEEAEEEDAARALSAKAPSQISTVAGLAGHQILECQKRLARHIESRNLWTLASHLESSWQQALRALLSLESAMRVFEDLPANDHGWFYIEESLAIRREYSRFRDTVLGDGEPEAGGLETRLRRIERHLADLRGQKIYPCLRIDDRRQLRSLGKRIVAWQEGAQDSLEGLRLWQDLSGFVRLLSQINWREELVEHDREILGRAEGLVNEMGGGDSSKAVRGALSGLLGRDRELDRWLGGPGPWTAEELAIHLTRLRAELRL